MGTITTSDGTAICELDGICAPTAAMPGLERARMRLINGFAQGLLACHDFVIFVDVDEFLIPDPAKFVGLREFLAAHRDQPVIAPLALNLVHYLGVEGDLDPNRPVLEQR